MEQNPQLNVPYGYLHRTPKDGSNPKNGYNYTYCVVFMTNDYEVEKELPMKIGNNVSGRPPETVYRQFGVQLKKSSSKDLKTLYLEWQIDDKGIDGEQDVWVTFYFPTADEGGKSSTGTNYGNGDP